MRFEIPYGESTLTFDLPHENWLAPARMGRTLPAINLAETVRKELRKPLGSRPLHEIVRPTSRVVILSDDYTRPTPASAIIPAVLDELEASGVVADNVEVIVATGLHRPMNQQELRCKLGEEVLSRVHVSCHDANNAEALVYRKETCYGVPVWINRRVAEADVRIGVGLVEVHPWAGFAGGPKILCPGVAGRATINHTHALGLRPGVWFGRKSGNSMWENIRAVADQVGLDLVVNVVLGQGETCIGAYVGHYVEAQQAAIETFLSVNQIDYLSRPDIIIASANPKYHYFDQCLISVLNTASIVKIGGIRIVAAACPEGLGYPEIAELQGQSLSRQWSSPDEYWAETVEDDCENAPDALPIYRYLQLREQSELIFVSQGMPKRDAERINLRLSREIQPAIDEALRRIGPGAKVAVVPWAAMVALSVQGEIAMPWC